MITLPQNTKQLYTHFFSSVFYGQTSISVWYIFDWSLFKLFQIMLCLTPHLHKQQGWICINIFTFGTFCARKRIYFIYYIHFRVVWAAPAPNQNDERPFGWEICLCFRVCEKHINNPPFTINFVWHSKNCVYDICCVNEERCLSIEYCNLLCTGR